MCYMEDFNPVETLTEPLTQLAPLPEGFNERRVMNRLLPITPERVLAKAQELRAYFEHDGKTPDVMVVLAGGVSINPEQQLESPLFTTGEDNNKMITGAKYRVLSATIGAVLYPED